MKKLLLLTVLLCGCSDATLSSISALGKPHHIKQYSGGVLVGEWDSTGMVKNEPDSDGYYFEDRKTGKIVMISGDVQITLE